jgi:deazaflavin-dependent oxidoreductase (nitroreductase family)
MKLSHAFDRWLYRAGRPNPLGRAINRTWSAAYGAGLWPKRLASLEVTGRRTGRTVRLPVVIADHDGERYLVSMLGEQANWVRNVRAAGGRARLRHGGAEDVVLEDVAPEQRPPILRRYLACAPGARSHVAVRHDAPVEAFELVAAELPVFRITRARPTTAAHSVDRKDPT